MPIKYFKKMLIRCILCKDYYEEIPALGKNLSGMEKFSDALGHCNNKVSL
jgi:hypothetical protein